MQWRRSTLLDEFFRRASLHPIVEGIAQLVERLVRNELLVVIPMFSQLLFHR